MKAIDTLRLVYPHWKDVEGTPECDPRCYRCEIEREFVKMEAAKTTAKDIPPQA